MATDDREIFRILAKHVHWQDEGDRITVADYFGRDVTDPDPFRPFSDDENDARNRDNRTAADESGEVEPDDNDDNLTESDKTGNPAKLAAVKSGPTPTKPRTSR